MGKADPAVVMVDHADLLGDHDGRAALASLLDDLAVGSSRASVLLAVRDRDQVADLEALAAEAGVAIRFVKPHGALYNQAQADPDVAKNDEITLVVQINGKVRDKMSAPADADGPALERLALDSPKVREALNGNAPRKVIVVPGKLVNVVA